MTRAAPVRQARWCVPLRLLHWATAPLMIGLVLLGLVMVRLHFDLGTSFALYQWHKSLGFVVLALLPLRLALRASFAAPRAPPATTRRARIEQRAARAVHLAFYLLMAALPLSGWLMNSASPLHLPLRLFSVIDLPDLAVAPGEATFETCRQIHAWLAYGLVALVLLHAAAALKHHLWDRDDVLRRMTW